MTELGRIINRGMSYVIGKAFKAQYDDRFSSKIMGWPVPNVSILHKNRYYIANVLNRNIGSITYNQTIKTLHNPDNTNRYIDTKIGDVIKIGTLDEANLLEANGVDYVRNQYSNYVDYAIEKLEREDIKDTHLDINWNVARLDNEPYKSIKFLAVNHKSQNFNRMSFTSSSYRRFAYQRKQLTPNHDMAMPYKYETAFDQNIREITNIKGEVQEVGNYNFDYGNYFTDTRTYGVYSENNTQFQSNEAKGDYFYHKAELYAMYPTFAMTNIKGNGKADLVQFTNQNFQNNKYRTIISKFSTTDGKADKDIVKNRELEIYNTAVSKYGTSHGNNLLKLSVTQHSGYDNPYCRVWTVHHAYGRYNNTIRPFSKTDQEIIDGHLANGGDKGFSLQPNRKRLRDHGVLHNDVSSQTNLVTITPTKGKTGISRKAKDCMFSIENLAWKGCTADLSEEQIGPLGGRIMWFPPYDLTFDESTSARWNTNNFIGRGEPVYTYTNTERSGNLNFKILIDHPSIVNFYLGGEYDTNEFWDQTGPEYDLLRFFAGCSVPEGVNINQNPSPKPPTVDPQVDPEPECELEPPLNTPPKKPVRKNEKLIFYAFYPNNYSGWYDYEHSQKPLEYLVNGFGSEIMENYRGNGYEVIKDKPVTPESVLAHTTKGEACSGVTIDNLELKPILNTENRDGGRRDWWYRIDCLGTSAYTRQQLIKTNTNGRINQVETVKSYSDTHSFGLNGKNIRDKNILELLKIPEEEEKYLYSLTEMYAALDGPSSVYLFNHNAVDRDKVNELQMIIKNLKEGTNGTEIAKVVCTGFASQHGRTSLNKDLSTHRAKTIQRWLQDNGFKDIQITPAEVFEVKTSAQEKGGKVNENELLAKAGRCVRVMIEYSTEDTNTLQAEQVTTDKEAVQGEQIDITKNEKICVKTKVEIRNTPSDSTERYDNEYRFFNELASTNSFIRNKITEKCKYFDPAFHSITPEGFNARLTFLNQCTRQGPTVGNSDFHTKSANNLAFGRQPVCVLRLGDFYNTKIIIESVNIRYDTDLVWDLNPEGIGVQPMSASISIGFKFIGGSDLGGPIGRLQNAVSFNYYANTSVYDNRSEQIEYNNHEVSSYSPFNVNGVKTKK